MEKDKTSHSHDRREQAWLMAWCAVANAIDCKSPGTAASWADECLKRFDQQFPSPNPQTKSGATP